MLTGRMQNDLSADNVMLSEDLSQCALIDFDATHAEGYLIQPGDKDGTPGWRAPERSKVVSKENDLWALRRLEAALRDPRKAKEDGLIY